jgi:uncharacterized protein YbjT (DUF2867 family)
MVLITGASGNSGIALIRCLRHSGLTMRAMVRRPQDFLRETLPGVEFVNADFDDFISLRSALSGIRGAFLVTNSSEDVEEQQLRFVRAAQAAGVRHIVYLSQLHASRESPVRFLRYHAVVEDAIVASGIAFTHLRPNLFMQGLLSSRSSIAGDGRFYAPAGNARVSIVDLRDIADVAAAALSDRRHEGRIYDITGPESLTHTDIAGRLSEALNRDVTFVDVPEASWRDVLLNSPGVPKWQADGLIEDYAHYRRGEAAAISGTVEEVTGHRARSFTDFARDYLQAFRSEPNASTARTNVSPARSPSF